MQLAPQKHPPLAVDTFQKTLFHQKSGQFVNQRFRGVEANRYIVGT